MTWMVRSRPLWLPHLVLALVLGPAAALVAQDELSLNSPGLRASRMDSRGRLVEDWGALGVTVTGEAAPAAGPTAIQSVRLSGGVPGVEARTQYGPVTLTLTAFRAPAWPAGLDVLTVKAQETAGQETRFTLGLDLPEGAQVGRRTVMVGGRAVLSLLDSPSVRRGERDWGFSDEAQAMPGWAQPEGECDPAFRNIRAGMGGVPIAYRFAVEPKAAVNVVMGFCESHWAASGQRVLSCRVEGAPAQQVDPVARWGQHIPGALLFQGRDANGDGRLEVSVLPDPSAADQNPILNALWLFPADQAPDLREVLQGKLNDQALRYVDVGGPGDQSLYPPGKLEYEVALPARGSRELVFYVACPGGTAPVPGMTSWTPELLLQAARDVWRDWPQQPR